MLNKSNSSFFEYLSEKIYNFFNDINYKLIGKSYYLQLDSEKEVDEFYKAMSKNANKVPFEVEEYESFCLKTDIGNEILMAAASYELNVTESFLVNIRNEVKKQKLQFNNLNVLFIFCNFDLDSITNGASNILSKGMPLDFQKITNEMEKDIEQSRLNKVEKSIVKYDIFKKLDNSFQSNIFDLAQDLSYIKKDKLEIKDYNDMGLFIDNFSEDLSQDKVNARCEINSYIYGNLALAQTNNEASNYVDKNFEGKNNLISKLKNEENWNSAQFIEVVDAWNKMHARGAKLVINSQISVDQSQGFDINISENTAKNSRIKNIIIFNSFNLEECQMTIPFNAALPTLSNINISDKDVDKVAIKNSNCDLLINARIKPLETCFKKIVIKIGNNRSINFTLNVCFIPLDSELFEFNKDYIVEPKKQEPSINFSYSKDSIILGNQDYVISDLSSDDLCGEEYYIPDNKGIELTPSIIEDRQNIGNISSDTILNIILNDISIPFKFIYSTNSIKQIKLNDIILKKIMTDCPVSRSNRNIYLNGMTWNLASTKELQKIELEEYMIDNEIFFGEIDSYSQDKIIKSIDINIPDEIKESYYTLIDYFSNINKCPITAQITPDLVELYKTHIKNFYNYLEKIRNSNSGIIDVNERELMLLGALIDGSNTIRFTSFNIVSIINQVNFYSSIFEKDFVLKKEDISQAIYSNFNGLGLLPLFSINKNYCDQNDNNSTPIIYNSISEDQCATWIKYSRVDKKVEDESNRYLDQIVKSKLNQFKKHYIQLFEINKNLPLVINAIKLGNNIEFLKGILGFIRMQWVKKKEIEPIPVVVNFYNEEKDTTIFDTFLGESDLTNINHLIPIEYFEHRGYDSREVLRLFQESIKYYQYKIDSKNIRESHVTFINRDNNDLSGSDNMYEIPTGISLKGLMSSISNRQPDNNEPRFGFGLRGLPNSVLENSINLKTIKYLNEFAYMIATNSNYTKDTCLVLLPSNNSNNFIDLIYRSSEWVTFINPYFGVDYFYNCKDLMIIHYSDQLQNSENYDAITVTQKTEVFKTIISKELKRTPTFEDNITDENVNNFITFSTCINGNWLLDLMLNQNKFKTRASFSEIATYKVMMAFLHHKDILWIPISLEEVLRIAGDQKIGDESIFYELKKEIDNSTNSNYYSDDILLIGIENTGEEKLKVHIYPVEVKANNSTYSYSQLQRKGITQTKKTIKLLNEALINFDKEIDSTVKKYYRHFFINLALINARKLILANAIDFELNNLELIRGKLINEEFMITKALDDLIGKGCVTIFSNQNSICSFSINEDNIAILNFPLEYMRKDVLSKVKDIKKDLDNGLWDNVSNYCISSKYTDFYRVNYTEKLLIKKFDEENLVRNEVKFCDYDIEPNIDDFSIASEPFDEIVNSSQLSSLENIKDIRIFLGIDKITGDEIYWEYGNKELPNKHAMVTGVSGQGKSYVLHCMLLEFSKNNVNSVIIDYSNSFTDEKREEEFERIMTQNNKFKEYLIFIEGLNINPFKKGFKIIGGKVVEDDSSEIADRFSNVISKIYKFGAQQNSLVYSLVKNGLDEYGDQMTLSVLRDSLQKINDSTAKTVLSKLQLFFDKDPFNYSKPIDWELINRRDGICYLFELDGYSDEMKSVLSDFILWDLYYYKAQNKGENIPLPIVLDEVHNLSRGKKSPVYKILNEGRKNNIGGIFVTQELTKRFDPDTVNSFQNSSEKIFFRPPEGTVSDMATTLYNADKSRDKKYWANLLSNNPKRHCIINGPAITANNSINNNKVTQIEIVSIPKREERWRALHEQNQILERGEA